jgi:hypothetical protein
MLNPMDMAWKSNRKARGQNQGKNKERHANQDRVEKNCLGAQSLAYVLR